MKKQPQQKQETKKKEEKLITINNGRLIDEELETIDQLLFPPQTHYAEPTLAQWEKINKKIMAKIHRLETVRPGLHQKLTTIKDRLTTTDSLFIKLLIPAILILLAIILLLVLLLFDQRMTGELVTGLLWPIFFK